MYYLSDLWRYGEIDCSCSDAWDPDAGICTGDLVRGGSDHTLSSSSSVKIRELSIHVISFDSLYWVLHKEPVVRGHSLLHDRLRCEKSPIDRFSKLSTSVHTFPGQPMVPFERVHQGCTRKVVLKWSLWISLTGEILEDAIFSISHWFLVRTSSRLPRKQLQGPHILHINSQWALLYRMVICASHGPSSSGSCHRKMV
jgi:hypothetical protein